MLQSQLSLMLAHVWKLLKEVATGISFPELLIQVFGVSRHQAEELQLQLISGSTINLRVEVLGDKEMNGALGAYSPTGTSGEATIYLSTSLLSEATPLGLQTRVLLEEIGHHFDRLLNGERDSPGDEGELFAKLLLGDALTAAQIEAIQQSNDIGLVTVGGEQLIVEQAALVGDSADNTLTGTGSADTFTGNGGRDTFVVARGGSPLTFSGSGTNGSVSGFDTITDYTAARSGLSSGETIQYSSTTSVLVVANGTGTGTPSSLRLRNNKPISSYSVSNGIISFDSNRTFKSARAIGSIAELAAAAQFLLGKDLGPEGSVVVFRATIDGQEHSYVWIQGAETASAD
ncbi:MAG: hypothetical protein R6W06_04910, partial [Prochlorococcaceae cyanobacterium]